MSPGVFAADKHPIAFPAHRKKRHNRPKNAADDTLPIFEDQPTLIFCPYTLANHKNGHYAPASAFGKNKGRPSGLSTYCKACRSVAEKKYRKRANRKDLTREMRKLGTRIEKAVARALSAIRIIEQTREE